MSFKLVDKIKKSNLPGPMKKVFEAYVSFGNSDGTNIRPTGAKVGRRAGCSQRTVERYTPRIVSLGLLVHDRDEQGNYLTYSYPKEGVWAYVYHVDISPLSNPAVVEGFEMHRQAVSGARRRARGKGSRSRQLVLFEDIKMAETLTDKLSETLPVILSETPTDKLSDRPYPYTSSLRSLDDQAQTDPSAVSTAGSELVSELVSESVSQAPPTSSSSPREDGVPQFKIPKSLEPEVACIMGNLYPEWQPELTGEQTSNLLAVVVMNQGTDWNAFFAWNRAHKSGGLVYRSVNQFLKGWQYSMNDYARHNLSTCGKCRLLAKQRLLAMILPCEWCQEESGSGEHAEFGVCDKCWSLGRRKDGMMQKQDTYHSGTTDFMGRKLRQQEEAEATGRRRFNVQEA